MSDELGMAAWREKPLDGDEPWIWLPDATSRWSQVAEQTAEGLRKPESGT
jgi:hypothetical protein